MERPFPRTRSFRPALLLCVLWFAGCSSAARGPYILHPLPPADGSYRLSLGTLVYDTPGMRVTASPADWRSVAAGCKDGSSPIFGPPDGVYSRFLFITLKIDNLSDDALSFSSFRATLLPDRGKGEAPLDVSDVYVIFAGDPDLEERALSFRKTSFDGALTLEPGQSVQRFLVFRAPEEKIRAAELVIDDTYLGAVSHDMTFRFEAFPMTEQN